MSSMHVPAEHNWDTIWKQHIPPKVRSFLWRVAHSCLPTRSCLVQKGLPCDDTCVNCDALAESHVHLFFVCEKALKCWERIHLDDVVRNLVGISDNFTTLLFDFLRRLPEQKQHIATMILWSIWKSRNTKLWENKDTPPPIIVKNAQEALQEWQVMQRARQQGQHPPPTVLWSPPPPSALKCNVDCALFNNNTTTTFGFCFRDFSGHLIWGMSNYIHISSSPAEAEAYGLFEAVKFAIHSDMGSVIFESDCKFIVDNINSPLELDNEIGDILSRCKELLATHNSYVVRHVRRQANRVAHTIARASLSFPSPHIFNVVPDHLYSLIFNEMA